ncbi:MAG: hypothetical protein WD941_03790 [Opitutus sp.]
METKKAATVGTASAMGTWTHSGLHDIPTGGAILDEALAAFGFGGAFLGGGHSAASGFFCHGLDC